jgi:membrane protein DedA with SNARE-associated domain
MIEWLNELISGAFGALGQGNPLSLLILLLVTVLTEAGVPFPFVMDSALFVSGFETGTLTLQLALTMLAVFTGRQVGASIIYWLFRLPGTAITTWIEKRFPSFHSKLQNVTEKLHNRAVTGIALTRLTGLLTLVSGASGLLRVRYIRFIAGVALSSIIFDGALVVTGIIAGTRLQQYGYTPTTLEVVLGCMLMVVGIMAIQLVITRLKNNRKQDRSNTRLPEKMTVISDL